MCRIHTPDGWTLIKIEEDGKAPIYKIFGSWSQGRADAWRISSGFDDLSLLHADDEGRIVIPQFSGAEYHVELDARDRHCAYGASVLHSICQTFNDAPTSVHISLVDAQSDDIPLSPSH